MESHDLRLQRGSVAFVMHIAVFVMPGIGPRLAWTGEQHIVEVPTGGWRGGLPIG